MSSRRLVPLATITLLLLSMALALGSTSSADEGPATRTTRAPQTLVVDAAGGGDYFYIQNAVDAAREDDTVLVRKGEYHETVTINKTITLQGEGPEDTLVNGSFEGVVVRVDAPDCVIRDIGIIAGGYFTGLRLGADGTTVDNCLFAGSMYGLLLKDSSRNTVTNCTLYWNGNGIQLSNSGFNRFSSCTSDWNYGSGVDLFSGYTTAFEDCSCSHNNDSGFYLYWLSDNNTFTDCVGDDNRFGIYMMDSFGNVVQDSTFERNSMNALMLQSANSTVRDCVLDDSGEEGIYGYHSEDNLITGCSVSDSGGRGVYMKYCQRNTFRGNTVARSAAEGFKTGMRTRGNMVHGNLFLCNNDWKRQAEDIGVDNEWDDGIAGNFWTDMEYRYPAAAPNGTGWDTSYGVAGSAGAADRFPYVEPPSPVAYDCGQPPDEPPEDGGDGANGGDGGGGEGVDGGEGGDDANADLLTAAMRVLTAFVIIVCLVVGTMLAVRLEMARRETLKAGYGPGAPAVRGKGGRARKLPAGDDGARGGKARKRPVTKDEAKGRKARRLPAEEDDTKGRRARKLPPRE